MYVYADFVYFLYIYVYVIFPRELLRSASLGKTLSPNTYECCDEICFGLARTDTSFGSVFGYDQKHRQDRLNSDLRHKVLKADNCPPGVHATDMLESAIDFMLQEAKKEPPELQSGEMSLRFLRLFALLLTAHHVLQHVSVYSSLRRMQAELLTNVFVLVSTTTSANKLNAMASPWSRTFCDTERALCMPDEIQTLGNVEVAGPTILPLAVNDC